MYIGQRFDRSKAAISPDRCSFRITDIGKRTYRTALEAVFYVERKQNGTTHQRGGGPLLRPPSLLDLIGFIESTDKGAGYNETLAYAPTPAAMREHPEMFTTPRILGALGILLILHGIARWFWRQAGGEALQSIERQNNEAGDASDRARSDFDVSRPASAEGLRR